MEGNTEVYYKPHMPLHMQRMLQLRVGKECMWLLGPDSVHAQLRLKPVFMCAQSQKAKKWIVGGSIP